MKKILINRANGHQIRRSGTSSYFLGKFNDYGRYAWEIKYYRFENDYEVEQSQLWAFGEHVKLSNGQYGFEHFTELFGRDIVSHIDGRSGGWLVIQSELSKAELRKIDTYISAIMKALPQFLNDERQARVTYGKD
jgi:hypothetical protein